MRFVSSPTTTGLSGDGLGGSNGRYHQRRITHPFRKSTRSKPRRWPLVLRFIKGAIHGAIVFQVLCHALFTILVVALDKYVYESFGLPPTIIPSLSIVVGLILVFRNQTSYNRFWDGRIAFNAIHSANRNLIRTILTHSTYPDRPLNDIEKADIERIVRILVAFPYAVKHYVRAEWGVLSPKPGSVISETVTGVGGLDPEYASLLPAGFEEQEAQGLGVPLQLTFFVDSFIKRGQRRGWYDAPGASSMGNQLNALIDAYGKMETIKLTPIPIAHLIHQKQVLALFGCVLPFAMVDDLGWWTVPIVSVVIFTLYGIEGIGTQLEDPFGYDRNDIKMDAIVEDERVEIEAVLNEWKRIQDVNAGINPNNGDHAGGPADPSVGRNGIGNGAGSPASATNGQTNRHEVVMPRKEMFIR